MTQDARDQEHENTQPSDTSASGESPQQTSSSDDAVGNEDLATAFLRETEVVEEAVEDGKEQTWRLARGVSPGNLGQ